MMEFPSIPLNFLDWVVLAGSLAVLFAPLFLAESTRRAYSLWAPRILIGLAVVLLVYFTQRTYRFGGALDDTFLAADNLNRVRGPLAKEEYYRRGLPDYKGKPLFTAEPEPSESADLPESATASETIGASTAP